MSFNEQIRRTYKEYLLYLNDGRERIALSPGKRFSLEGLVHASTLMDCPLKAASEVNGVKPVFESLIKENNPTLMHRMMQGTRMAEIFQEAFVYDKSNYYLVYTEYSLSEVELHLQGTIDLAVKNNNGIWHIIEFKHRLPNWKDKFPQPRIGDVYQLIAYQEMFKTPFKVESHLVIINTPSYADFYNPNKGFEVWDLIENEEGFMLQNEEGNLWNNNPITRQNLYDEIDRQLSYLNGNTQIPIRLGSDESWQCRSNIKYPKESNLGKLKAMCPYFCHSDNPELEMTYYIDENGTQQIVENPF